MTETECFEKGYQASQEGKERRSPYESDSYRAESWYAGYDAATTNEY